MNDALDSLSAYVSIWAQHFPTLFFLPDLIFDLILPAL